MANDLEKIIHELSGAPEETLRRSIQTIEQIIEERVKKRLVREAQFTAAMERLDATCNETKSLIEARIESFNDQIRQERESLRRVIDQHAEDRMDARSKWENDDAILRRLVRASETMLSELKS